jgi:hypothetical protein
MIRIMRCATAMLVFWGPHRFSNRLYTAEIRVFFDLMAAHPAWHKVDFRPLGINGQDSKTSV